MTALALAGLCLMAWAALIGLAFALARAARGEGTTRTKRKEQDGH